MALAFALTLALVMAMPSRASAAEVYDGSISTTYITIFRDIATKIGPADDYVFFRSGQYEYQMYVGDLTYENDSFTGTGLKVYTISTAGSGYSNAYTYDWSTSDLELAPGTALIYSNLGEFPDLIERSDYLAYSQILLLFIGLCIVLLRPIFSFCLRPRS